MSPWVRKEDYEAFRAISEDADALPDTWEKFAQITEMFEDKIRTSGCIIVRAYIDPESFPDWCRLNGVSTNTDGRQKFALTIASETHGGEAH